MPRRRFSVWWLSALQLQKLRQPFRCLPNPNFLLKFNFSLLCLLPTTAALTFFRFPPNFPVRCFGSKHREDSIELTICRSITIVVIMTFNMFQLDSSRSTKRSITNSTTSRNCSFQIPAHNVSPLTPWNNVGETEVHFCEYRGDGVPNDNLGVFGDTYLDLAAPGGYVLYGKRPEGWTRWPGFDPIESGLTASSSNPLGNFVFHPRFEQPGCQRILFCDGRSINWFTPESVPKIVSALCANGIINRIPVDGAKTGSNIIANMLNEAMKLPRKRALPSPDANSGRKRAKMPPIQCSSSHVTLPSIAQAIPLHNRLCEKRPPLAQAFPTGVSASASIIHRVSSISQDHQIPSNLQQGGLQTKLESRTENATPTKTAMDVSQAYLLQGRFLGSGFTQYRINDFPGSIELEAARRETQEARAANETLRLEVDSIRADKSLFEARLGEAQTALTSQRAEMRKYRQKTMAETQSLKNFHFETDSTRVQEIESLEARLHDGVSFSPPASSL